MDKQRRGILKAAGSLTATGMLLPLHSVADEKAPVDAITSNTLKEAEKLTGVPYTESERELMLKSIGGQIKKSTEIRELGMRNADLAPALQFDPRLPGTKLPDAKWLRERKRAVPRLPNSEADIAYAPVNVLSEWIRSKQLSSRRLTEIYLRRIDKYARGLESIITVTRDHALKRSAEADREIAAGRYRGALHGIPYGAKDLLDTKDIATTWGAMPYKDRVADQDAAVIERLNEAGAVMIAKTTMGALAGGDLWFDGLTRNPWNTEEGSGGSSAGSASSVAAALMGFAIGTETLGSIENPAARNGVAGLRPTFGRVSRYGSMTLCWSMDKIGPMCRSVEDTALVLNAINGFDVRDAGSIEAPFNFDNRASVKGLRIGYMKGWFNKDETPDALREMPGVIKALGMELVEIELPDLPYGSLMNILFVEASAALEELTLSQRDDLLRGQTSRAWPNMTRQARFISAVDYIQADRLRRRVMHVMHEQFEGLDAIIGSSTPTQGAGTIMTPITNFTGHPALTLRIGFTKEAARRGDWVDEKFYGSPSSGIKKKVPVCLNLWGPLFEDGKICQIGIAIENKLNIQGERPKLSG